MDIDKFGQHVYNEQDICDLFLQNPNLQIKDMLVNLDIEFHPDLELTTPKLLRYESSTKSINDFDDSLQQNWHMPEEYKNMDIALFILNQCKNEAELQRAGEELFLFQERGMFPLLQYLKYLVDTMRQENIVWGVGRGSSVASFVLFLLGVHRINSLYYDLSIDEFLK
jgi:DNA polymerase III alpha subunit